MNRDVGKIAAVMRLAHVTGTMLAAALLLLAASLLTQQRVVADDISKKDSRRAFYLTPLQYDGSQASTACAAGFHMASLWEILDPSNLRYDTTLGFTQADSGAGPPSNSPSLAAAGWVRTGFDAHVSFNFGQSNCDAWKSNSSSDRGSITALNSSWGSSGFAINPWLPAVESCNNARKVWCMQDRHGRLVLQAPLPILQPRGRNHFGRTWRSKWAPICGGSSSPPSSSSRHSRL